MPRQTSESKHDRETWSPELDWYLNCRDAACGVQSSFSSQIAAIERGGAGGGGALGEDGSFVHPYNDQQVSNVKYGARAFAMDRRMRVRWAALAINWKSALFVHYTGAFPSGGNGGQQGRQRWPKGVEARLGEFAGAALFMALQEGKLQRVLKACEKGDDKALVGLLKRAEAGIRDAHRAYYALTDQEAQSWVDEQPNVPGIMTVRGAPEPHWLDPELWAAEERNQQREEAARQRIVAVGAQHEIELEQVAS
jgi:hypothetical protein